MANNIRTTIIISETPSGGVGGPLELYDDYEYAFNYAVAEIRDVSKRNKNYSGTLKVPGCPQNDILLENIHMINGDRTWNPNKKAIVTVLCDEETIFVGKLRVMNIYVSRDEKIEYELNLSSLFGDFTDELKPLTLGDLDFSKFNHILGGNIVTNSWDTSIQQDGATVSFNIGNGYVYPMIDYGIRVGNIWDVKDFRPCLYTKEVIDTMFEKIDVIYNSAFFNSDYFKKLIIPSYSLAFLDEFTVDAAKFRVARTNFRNGLNDEGNCILNVDSGIVLWEETGPIDFQDETPPTYFDNSGQWTTNTFTTITPGVYTFTVGGTAAILFKRRPQDFGGGQFNIKTGSQAILTIKFIKNGTTVAFSESFIFPAPIVGGLVGSIASCNQVVTSTGIVNMQEGDTLSVVMRLENQFFWINNLSQEKASIARIRLANPNDTPPTTGTPCNDTPSQPWIFLNALSNETVLEGSPMNLNTVLDPKVKQLDFFMSICNMFNLYVYDDPDNPGTLLIEPREDFYNSLDESVDWTYKLDRQKGYDITPMGELDFLSYYFTYTEDGDYFNAKYKQQNGDRIFGDRTWYVDNDFITNTKTLTLIFGPTPLVQDFTSDRVIPTIVTFNETYEPYDHSFRILIYSGLLPCGDWYLQSNKLLGVSGTHSTYPYCGHFDDPYNPTEDLNWDLAQVYYHPLQTYTDRNIFNKYWTKYIEQITSKNSSIVTGWFELTPSDIAILDMRRKVFFDGNYYTINRIIDYNPSINLLTEVELLKLDTPPNRRTSVAISTGFNPTGLSTITSATEIHYQNPHVTNNSGVTINPNVWKGIGKNNSVGNSNSKTTEAGPHMISGNRISIGAGSQNVVVMGSNDVNVIGSLEKVVVLGADTVDVNQSNTILLGSYIQIRDGKQFPNADLEDGGEDIVQAYNANFELGMFDPYDDFLNLQDGIVDPT